MTDNNTCPLCGAKDDSDEHIIPKWLQDQFSLKDQLVDLKNENTLQYCQMRLPICSECNGYFNDHLEQKVRKGDAIYQEYYLWALKIRYFAGLKDTTLRYEISDPSKGSLVSDKSANIGNDLITHLLTNLDNDNFSVQPKPFGSVFLCDNPINDGKFGMGDIAHPHWGFGIELPDNKLLFVLFMDRGMVKRDMIRIHKQRHRSLYDYLLDRPHHTNAGGESTNFLIKLALFRLLAHQLRIDNIPLIKNYRLNENGVFAKVPDKVKYRDKKDINIINLRKLAKYCQLSPQVAEYYYQSL